MDNKNIINKLTHKRLKRRDFLAGSAAGALALSFGTKLNAFGAEEKKLNFMNWDTYIGPNTISDFNKVSGIDVKMDYFANNEELFGKLRNGNPGYDVIVPSGDMVERMISLDMLVKLDKSKIPNFKNLFTSFKDASFDPSRQYSITYMWGTVGLGYNKKRVSKIDSWQTVYDSGKYSQKIALSGSSTEIIPLALKYLGYSANDLDPKKLDQVEKLLIKQKKHIKLLHNDDGQDLLISGNVLLAQEYSGDIAQIIAEEPGSFEYLIPKEGGLVWQDNLAIPKGAPHVENAHAFINFLLDAKIGRDIADEIRYATPNEAAYKLMDEGYRSDPVIYPPDDVLAKCETVRFFSVKESQLLDRIMTRFRAA